MEIPRVRPSQEVQLLRGGRADEAKWEARGGQKRPEAGRRREEVVQVRLRGEKEEEEDGQELKSRTKQRGGGGVLHAAAVCWVGGAKGRPMTISEMQCGVTRRERRAVDWDAAEALELPSRACFSSPPWSESSLD
jgi:hypothetical protein